MPFSFDDSEFAEQSEAADAALKSLEASPEPANDPAEDPELADVDLRLETADYYRAILNHEFFDVESPAAQIVDREIRAFIRERLEILLGLRTPREPEVVNPFSDEETKALKVIAAKVLGKPGLVAETQATQVKKMPTPAPTKAPAAKPMIKPKPLAKKIPAPPAAPSTKPKAKPGPKPKQEAQPAAPAQPERKTSPTVENPEVQTFVDHEGKKVTLVEGEIIEENGQRFIVARNEKGTLYRKNITGQVAPANRLPPMTAQQLSIVSQQQAEAQIASLDQLTGLAVIESIKSR